MIALVWLAGTWWWVVALATALAVAASVWLERHAARRTRALLGARADAVAGARRAPAVRRACDVGALVAIGLALLRPVGVGSSGEDGADVVFAVDVSWSMAARDSAPSRLGAVHDALAALAARAGASRFGLVTYAGDAALAVPLTADGAAVVAVAAELVPGAVGRPGTDPGAALDLAVRQLERSGRGGTIVLCSDGEDFAASGVAAAERARARGVLVHVVGCGDVAGSKIPVAGERGESFLRDADGADVVTRLEVDRLRAIAAAGGGWYVPVGADALVRLHDDELLPAARAAAVRAGRREPEPLQAWPLLVALLLWMLRACLPERSR